LYSDDSCTLTPNFLFSHPSTGEQQRQKKANQRSKRAKQTLLRTKKNEYRALYHAKKAQQGRITTAQQMSANRLSNVKGSR
jgi:hypothetical protein